jgi:hypothetical protein
MEFPTARVGQGDLRGITVRSATKAPLSLFLAYEFKALPGHFFALEMQVNSCEFHSVSPPL